ncbi:MAG: DUF11 domain-containing protein, partial [Erysipelotrichaceae bacterium]|nr:DUF11 domain-containing protein [Erysipelotrichaceae bacterium]
GTSYKGNTTYVVTDANGNTLDNVVVTTTENKDAGSVKWELSLEAGQTVKVTFDVEVLDSAVDNPDNVILNYATLNIDNGSDIQTNTVTNTVPEKDVVDSKGNSIDGDLVSVGDTLTYTIDYKNTEDDVATVTITDDLDSDVTFVSADNDGECAYDETLGAYVVTWTIKDVPSGQSGKVSFKVTVNESAAGTTVDNQAIVRINDNPEVATNTVTNTVPEKTVTINNVDVNGDLVGVGQELTYTISYKNTEDGYATVFITDELDENVTFVSADNGGTYNSSTHKVVWVLSNLASGTEGTVSFKVTVNASAAGETVDNQALVKVGNSSAYTNKVTNTVPKKTVTINNVDVDGDTVNVGDTLTYSVYYKNTESDAATIVITDTLDSKVTYVNGSASDNGVYDKSTRTITWTLENVPAGESGYVTFNVTVNEEAAGETVENTAYVKVGDNPAVQTNTVTNNVPKADTPTTTSEPKTGDNTHIALYVVCGLAALGLIALIRRRKEED